MPLDWMENDVVLVSSKDQKAVGYVVEPANKLDSEGENATDAPPGPVVLYIAKIPSELLLFNEEDESFLNEDHDTLMSNASGEPLEMIRRICSRAVQSWNKGKDMEHSIRCDPSDQILFRKSVTAMLPR